MITKELIARINELSNKQKHSGLTESELQEQTVLRRQYIDAIKAQVRAHIETTPSAPGDSSSCSCGCHGEHKH